MKISSSEVVLYQKIIVTKFNSVDIKERRRTIIFYFTVCQNFQVALKNEI